MAAGVAAVAAVSSGRIGRQTALPRYDGARHTGGHEDPPSPARARDTAAGAAGMTAQAATASDARNALNALRAGLRLALLRRPSLDGLRLGPGLFWFAAAAQIGWSCLLDYLATDAPRQFDASAVESASFALALTLLASFILSRAWARDQLLWPIATLVTFGGLLPATVDSALEDHLLPRWAGDSAQPYWLCYAVILLWWIALVERTLLALVPGALAGRRLRFASLAVLLIAAPTLLIAPTSFWDNSDNGSTGDNGDDTTATAPADSDAPELVAEQVFAQQDALLAHALSRIAPSGTGGPHLYFLGVAPDGDQDVFLKEARYAENLFDTRFGTAGRSLILSNSRTSLDELPLASATNLRRTLDALGRRMNRDNDILFLFLTSHGSRDAELAVELEDLSFLPLSADGLAQMLKESGIRWKVIVVSACYSGSFIPALQDENTLIVTAARADRTSFGCSDDADFTYFGRAYLQDGLAHTASFADAFTIARQRVAQWETRDGEAHSEPQFVDSPQIEAKLAQWRTGLDRAAPQIAGDAARDRRAADAGRTAQSCRPATRCRPK
jgi:hypothetical protein